MCGGGAAECAGRLMSGVAISPSRRNLCDLAAEFRAHSLVRGTVCLRRWFASVGQPVEGRGLCRAATDCGRAAEVSAERGMAAA
jgi:hypothetical protein